MLEKVQYLYGVPHDRAFLSHECEACTGVYWEGGHEERNTHLGTFYKINTPWLFKGRERFWRTGPQCDYPPSDGSPIVPWGESGGDTPESRAQSPERPPQSSVRVIFLDSPSSSRQSTTSSEDSNFSSISHLLNIPPFSSSTTSSWRPLIDLPAALPTTGLFPKYPNPNPFSIHVSCLFSFSNP
jgi:hypothetical protein